MRRFLTRLLITSLMLWLPASFSLAMGMAYAQRAAACASAPQTQAYHGHHPAVDHAHGHHVSTCDNTAQPAHGQHSCHTCALCVLGLAAAPQVAALPLLPLGSSDFAYADTPARYIAQPLEHPPRA